ncbi:hypothetical protein V8E36_001550 [Tilletia maclaganii]
MSRRLGSLGSATAHIPKGRGLMLPTAHQKLPITSGGSKAGHSKARVLRTEAAQFRLRPFADATAALNASKDADQLGLGADDEDFDDLDDDEAVDHDDYRNRQGEHWSSRPSSPYGQALSDIVLDFEEDEDADDAHLDPRLRALDPRLRATSQPFRVETRGPAQLRQKAAQSLRLAKANPSIASIAELAGSDAFLERLSSQVADKVLKVLQPTMSKMAIEAPSSDCFKVSAALVDMVPEHAAIVKKLADVPQALTAEDYTRKTGEQVDNSVLWTAAEARTALARSKGVEVLPNNTEVPLAFALRDAQGNPVDDKRVDAIQELVRNIVDDILLPVKVMDDKTRLEAEIANGPLWTAWRNRIPEYNLTYFNKYHKTAVLEAMYQAEASAKELQYCHGHYKAFLVIKRRLRNVGAKGKGKGKIKQDDEEQEDAPAPALPAITQQPASITPAPLSKPLKKRSRAKTGQKDKGEEAAAEPAGPASSAKRRKAAGQKVVSRNATASTNTTVQQSQPLGVTTTAASEAGTVSSQPQTPGVASAGGEGSGITPMLVGATMSAGHHSATPGPLEDSRGSNPYYHAASSQVACYTQQPLPQQSGSPTPGEAPQYHLQNSAHSSRPALGGAYCFRHDGSKARSSRSTFFRTVKTTTIHITTTSTRPRSRRHLLTGLTA